MKINHHLDDSTIMAFASGALPPAFAVVASAHLQMCSTCRKKVARLQTVGGAILDDMKPVALSPGAANNLLERLDAEQRQTGEEKRAEPKIARRKYDGILPPVVGSLVGSSVDDVNWKRVGMGIATHQIDLGENAASKLYLMKIAAGHSVPEHGHSGHEVTLILSGAYNDECGRFAAGDVADLDPEVEHQPVVEADENCICLVAVERPARFKGLLPRLFQPIVGI